VTGVISWFRRWYGANPLHLLALLAAFTLAGYAVHAVVAGGQWRGIAIWFVVAIVGHDVLLFPLYSLADLSLRRLLPRWASWPRGQEAAVTGGADTTAAPPVINHVRVPAGFSLLLLLVWFPLILGKSSADYHSASGLTTAPYLWRWLAVTGVMFMMSAVVYAIRLRRMSARARASRSLVSRPDS
jgi:hypothetical protein